jgi:hypothetical protein
MTHKTHIASSRLDPKGRTYIGVSFGKRFTYDEHLTYCGRLMSKVTCEYANEATCVVCREAFAGEKVA